MTAKVERTPSDAASLRARIEYGPCEIRVDQHYLHLRPFWHELGQLLDQVEREQTPGRETVGGD